MYVCDFGFRVQHDDADVNHGFGTMHYERYMNVIIDS